MSFARALMVPLVILGLVAAFYGGAAPAIEPIFGIADTTIADNPDSPIESVAMERLSWMMFIGGPILFIASGFVFVLLFAVRAERVFG